jgi:bifunctional UDP-N-acetylglucosamine pyrophosphorylase/glucosamine-1-phosphate N-acetyltransferase
MGKRMNSKLHKVLHPVCGKPMVGHVIDLLKQANADRIVAVVGHGAEAVQAYLGAGVEYTLQEEQLGTGHAVLQAAPLLSEEEGITIVICGDTPLVRSATLERMIQVVRDTPAAATVMSVTMDNPHGYGRIVRSADGRFLQIVEQKDCTAEQREIKEINAGTYVFDNRKLFAALSKITNDNSQHEYYLTDVFDILNGQQETIVALCTEDATEGIGVNDRVGLAEAQAWMRRRINRNHMVNGVTLIDPENTYIDADVAIGTDSVIWPGTTLSGATVIGESCVIGPNSDIADSRIGNRVTIKQSVLSEAMVADEAAIGPFAYLRPGAIIGERVKVGDFVEIKNAVLGAGTKVSHLSYVGDAEVGSNVNIGCGAITVNYDGFHKHKTLIGDNAFVGSNVNLVAPVKVGEGALVAAGSTITRDVPDNDMAIARERQENRPGYAEKLRERIKGKKLPQ